MTQFHEGQEVEVAVQEYRGDCCTGRKYARNWRKAKIDERLIATPKFYRVQFPNGTRAVFDVKNIRAATDRIEGIAKRQAAYDGVPRISESGFQIQPWERLP